MTTHQSPENDPRNAHLFPKEPPQRSGYLEIRDYVDVHAREVYEVKKILSHEIRAQCAPEIEDYVDCTTDRFFTLWQCKQEVLIMRQCLKRIETPEYLARRQDEIMKERLENGESLLRYDLRKKYNRLFHASIPTPSQKAET